MVRVTIRIEIDEQSKASSILESLLPDNVGIPEGLSIDFHVDGKMLVLIFEASLPANGDSKKIASLIHTIDEVLDHINTMVRVMNVDTR